VSRQPSDGHTPAGPDSAPSTEFERRAARDGLSKTSVGGGSSDRSASSVFPSRSRRRLLALAGGGGLLATAGCLSALGSSGESNANVGLTPDRLAFPDGFAAESASLAGRYGDHGIWGLADGPGVDSPTYVGAYRDSLAVPSGEGSADGDGDGAPWVNADTAAVVYRLDGGVHRVWLWAGARARQPDRGLGRANVSRVSVGAIAGEGWGLEAYAPRGSFREGPVPVSLGERGPSGRTPLPGGGIAPDDGARTGSNGRFGVAWQGIARGFRSVNAVCELRPADEGDEPAFEATASFGVAGGRGAL